VGLVLTNGRRMHLEAPLINLALDMETGKVLAENGQVFDWWETPLASSEGLVGEGVHGEQLYHVGGKLFMVYPN